MWCTVCRVEICNIYSQLHQDIHVAQYKNYGELTSITGGANVQSEDTPPSVLAAFEDYASGKVPKERVNQKLFK